MYMLSTEPILEQQEDVKVVEEPRPSIPRPKTSQTFVNFAGARKKQIADQVCSSCVSLVKLITLFSVSEMTRACPIQFSNRTVQVNQVK